jgi:Sulfotransferase family
VSAQHVPDHVMLTTVVFDDLRLAYVPAPKAASTTILAALAEVAGLRSEDRVGSRKLEVTRALTVHDGSIWSSAHRLTGREPAELERILRSDEWFRFTVVREPARRIWSAWVSKVLVRNPRFVLMFDEDLFTAPPASAKDVVESFRRFVSALPDRPEWSDSHWSSQADLVGVTDITYSHVGRVEALGRTVAEVGEYMRLRGGALPTLGAGNRSYLPFSPGLLDRAAHEACIRLTARDCEIFGYEPVPYEAGEPDDRWYAAVEANIPAIQALIEQNERFLDVWRMLPDRKAGVSFRHPVRSARATASARFPRGRRGRLAGRLAVAAVTLAAMFVVLPEVLGDRPYDPHPSTWASAIENR